MIIKTVGDLKQILSNLDDDFNIHMRINKRLTEEELKNVLYPWPFETTVVDLEFDDIGYSDKDLCLSVALPDPPEKE